MQEEEYEVSDNEHVEENVEHEEVQEEETQDQEVPPPPIPPQYQEDAQERNWREMRKKLERLEKEAEELRLQKYKEEEKRLEDNIDPDEFLTYGQWQQIEQKKEELRRKSEEERKQRELEERLERERAEAPQKLRQKYNDFEQVVTMDNINRLIQEDPEIGKSLEAYNNDPYIQGKLAYEIIKGRYGKTQQYDQYTQKKIEQNQKVPTPSSAIKRSQALSSADAFANGLTPELKEQLWQEMEEYAKNT